VALESEDENELMDKIEVAMNFAEDIEDVLIPDALEYYLGLNEDFFDPDADSEDDDDDHEGGAGGDHDDDSDDDDDKKKPKGGKDDGGKKKGGKKGGDKN